MMKRASARDERGQILLLTVLSMTVLLGMAALSIDASFMYDKRNRLYAAADAAAKSAATEVHRGNGANMLAFAQQQVVSHGFALADVTLSVHLCTDVGATCAAPFASNPSYVEAIVSQVTDTFFGRILGIPSFTPGARAVAGTSPGPNCLVVFDDLTLDNSSIIQPTCGAIIGGALGGNGSITAKSIGAGSLGSVTTFPPAIVPIASPEDPLAGLPPPTLPIGAGCSSVVDVPLLPQVCYNNVTLSSMTNTILGPGWYYIKGLFKMGDNATLTGSGVTLYFDPGATTSFGKDVTITLSAPTTGVYNGIAWFFDRANNSPITLGVNSIDITGSVDITGAFYARASPVRAKNIGNAGDCALVVVGGLTLSNGAGELNNTCSAGGGSPILTISVAE